MEMIDKLISDCECELVDIFKIIDGICYENSKKVLDAFHETRVSASDFNGTTGYGYGDTGRDKIEQVYSLVFGAEDAIVRNQFISGTHALSVSLFALLRPGDKFISITGLPYDTLYPVIGITENDSSLKAFGVDFDYINLINNDFDYEKIKDSLDGVKLVHIQRSIGYGNRNTICIKQIEDVVKFIRKINEKIIIFVDNCYCEFCSLKEPTEVGADVVIGSLIKNLGAGIANNGAYVAGNKDLIQLVSERLTVPGQGKEVGPSLGQNRNFLLGLYLAPKTIVSALKVKALTNLMCKKCHIDTVNSNLDDIVLGILFRDKDKLISYTKSIQNSSAIDSEFTPCPTEMPGYDNDIIMASGSFVDGSSIELSCDAPIREPYILYQQGSLTYEYGKLAVRCAFNKLIEKGDL